jgi:hypothetical protein
MFEINYPNKFGVFASSIELSEEDFNSICNGPIAMAQELLNIDLARVDRE